MWQAVLPLLRQLLASQAVKGAAGAAASGATGAAEGGFAQTAADLLKGLGGFAGGGGFGGGGSGGSSSGSGASTPPGGPGPSPADQSAADAMWRAGTQAFQAMGTTFMHNAIGQALAGGGKEEKERSKLNSHSAELAYRMGGGPAGNRALNHMEGLFGGLADKLTNLFPGGKAVKQAVGAFDKTPLGQLGIAAVELADAFAKIPGLVEDWGDELLNERRKLAQFNGDIARAFAESHRRDILRNIESGGNVAGTTGNLADAVDDLKDTLQPVRDLGVNLLQIVATGVIRMVDTTLKIAIMVSPAMQAALAIQRSLAKSGEFSQMQNVMRAVGGINDKPQGVPKR